MMLKPDWDDIFGSRDVVRLLDTVELCHGKMVDLTFDDSEARVNCNAVIANLKMKSGQSVSDFKKEVKAAFDARARFNYHGEAEIPEEDKVNV